MNLRVFAFALLALACSSNRAPTPATPATPAPATDAAVAAADAAPAAPRVDPNRESVLAIWHRENPSLTATPEFVAGPVPWGPLEGRLVALVATSDTAWLVTAPTPGGTPAENVGQVTQIALSGEGTARAALGAMTLRDLTGDGAPEVVVFVTREQPVESYVAMQDFTRVFGISSMGPWMARPMTRIELQLLGVRDEAGLNAAAPTLGHYEAPTAGMSPGRLLARLPYANAAELRAVIAPAGLRLCNDTPVNGGPRRKRCTMFPRARLTDAFLTTRVHQALGSFEDFEGDDAATQLVAPSCQRNGDTLRCTASVGGPAGNDWTFTGDGETLRLVELSAWAEDS